MSNSNAENKNNPALFHIVEFNWPDQITPEMAGASASLHKVVMKAEWIDEVMTGYGGVGGGKNCIWIFRTESYKEMDLLLNPSLKETNDVTQAYETFFNQMIGVEKKLKHEVQFGK